jgi:hypothetical protein
MAAFPIEEAAMLSRVSLGGGPCVTFLLASLIPFIAACFTIVPAPHTADPARTYKLEVIAEPSQSASFILRSTHNGQEAFPSGTRVTIEVMANPGWVIQEWDGPVELTNGYAAQITMDQDHTVVLYMTPAD